MSARLRVAVDGTPLLGARTAIGHLTSRLLEELAARGDIEVSAYAVTARGRDMLAGAAPRGVRAATAPWSAKLVRELWQRGSWPRIERWTGPVDVVHATNFVAPPARAAVVVTVHDVTCVRYPELCTPDARRYPALVRAAVRRGAHVHVVSDTVGREVQELLGVPAEQVTRVYFGLAASGDADPAAGRRRAGADRYVLALGQLEPRKNLPRLVAAFDRVAEHDRELRLVLAGPDGWDRAGVDAARRAARHGDRTSWLGYVTDAERRDLLAGAAVLAYPSLYEGFGHPPLEAMLAGTPVVAARAGALPEALGDAAVLVDPLDADAIGHGLATVLGDDDLRATLVERGRHQAARYTWPDAITQLVELYHRVAA